MSLRDFIENDCRFCKKCFCCKKCREKHENNEHGIFPNCDICIYGKCFLSGASEEVLEHIKSAHWPLRCVFCKRIFGSSDELKKHSKCPVGLKILEDPEKSPYTPGQSYTDSIFDSPPLFLPLLKGQQPNQNTNMFSNLATSTPMQEAAEDNNLLQQIQEAITPVDTSETNKENIRKTKQQVSDDGSTKRKVTFCETPLPESYRKQKNVAKKHEKGRGKTVEPSSSSSGSPGIFYSKKKKPQKAAEGNGIDESKHDRKIPIIVGSQFEEKSEGIKKEDSTLWISAANGSPSEVPDTKLERSPDYVTAASTFETPVVAKGHGIDVCKRDRKIPTIVVSQFEDKEDIGMKKEDSTLWISATNASPSEIPDTKSEHSPDYVTAASTFQSPVVAKAKKRQVNVVMPTSITRNIKENLDPERNVGRHFISEDTRPADVVYSNGSSISSSPGANQGRLWISMNRLLRNVAGAIQGASSVQEAHEAVPNSIKRRSSGYDPVDEPPIKRYKLTEIKCRRTIRELPVVHSHSWQTQDSSVGSSYNYYRKKIFVDKATQTDF